jgi:hypothetical protein
VGSLTLVAGLMALGGAALLATPAPGAEPKSEVKDSRGDGRTWADRPERSVSVYTEYSQLTDPAHESVRVKRIVGYLPENVGFYEDMTGVQNLQYVARLNGIRDRDSRPKIAELLDRSVWPAMPAGAWACTRVECASGSVSPRCS